ncbi:MAG TPA: hypothetical protein GXZ95_04395 [Mollicutes bacterium]|nr:hypothetical protein [Mollicutes bacterium]
MLSRKELDYVRKINPPYPGNHYSLESLKVLKDALALYNDHYRNKEYDITFSDSSNLTFSIKESNLAHMLGLWFSTLKNHDYFKNIEGCRSLSYRIIEEIVANPKDILEINAQENYSLINFYRVRVRSQVFNNFSNFKNLDFGCIKYDSNVVNGNGIKTYMKADRFLFTERDQFYAPYYMMGIANQEGKNYIETLFADTFPKKMFMNQKITIPVSVSVKTDTSYDTVEATTKQKLDLLRYLKKTLFQYNCSFDNNKNTLSNNVRVLSKV